METKITMKTEMKKKTKTKTDAKYENKSENYNKKIRAEEDDVACFQRYQTRRITKQTWQNNKKLKVIWNMLNQIKLKYNETK